MSSLVLLSALVVGLQAVGDGKSAPDYALTVAPIFKKYCAGCHNDEDREGKFSVETYAAMQKGTAHGPAILPGDSKGSRIVRVLTGAAKPQMPPKDEPRPDAAEIAVLVAWIDSGARGPEGQEPDRMALIVPKVKSHSTVLPIAAMDASSDGRFIAVARGNHVGLYLGSPPRAESPLRSIGQYPGKVTSLHFTTDGKRLVTASGVAGLGGVAAIWNVEDGSLVQQFQGHRDILYDAELSPDGAILATCSYDKMIELWDAVQGKRLRTLEGHTGAVYDVAFSPDSRFLVSASADDTCKVWRTSDGQRMDTLPQPLKAEYSCTFSPDGETIVAGGADNNIRVWKFVSRDKPEINPMVLARYAHEGAIVKLAFTPDGSKLISLAEDRTIKIWRAGDFTELELWDNLPDVASALAISRDGSSFEVGRMDGSIASYQVSAKTEIETALVQAPPKLVESTAASAVPEVNEHEPNNEPSRANAVELPVSIKGVINGGENGDADSDLYKFKAKQGELWVFEVDAARSGSKLDSHLEIKHADGRRVPRVLLEAVRDSYFTFRGKNDSESGDFRVFNWQEMKLNEYLYVSGEVVKLWLYPRGPDSGFVVYPGQGNRWGWFDTTPLAHALGEPCYIVQPHQPGAKLAPNGLPTFLLYFENDDDSRRELGKDSRLFFHAPADGDYLVKIKDVRGLQGPDFHYSLIARPSRPDFKVSLSGTDPAVGPGGAKEFKASVQRIDGYDGPIHVDIQSLPPGFHSAPLEIEAGQLEAFGLIAADLDAKAPADDLAKASKVVASATIDGREITHQVNNLGTIKLGPLPKLSVTIGPADGGPKPLGEPGKEPVEFEIEAGQTIALTVKVERKDFKGQVFFGNEGSGRNLPFGVIVDNLGLNGLLVLENQQERVFFVTADSGAPEQTRLFHLTTGVEGGISSKPVILHVKKARSEVAAEASSTSVR